MEAMQEHMARLMKVVEDSSAAKSVGELSGVKLVPLSERDDIEAYLVTFERIMKAHKIKEDRWAHYLAPQLTGRAQLAFAALPTAESGKYESIRAAILQRYDINEEAYRRRFRTTTRGNDETNREYTVKLMDLQRKWLKEYVTLEAVQEAVGLEQFLNSLTMEQRVWVYEKKPKTCVEAGELADEYEQVRKQQPVVELHKKQAGDQDREKSPGKPGKSNCIKGDIAGSAAGEKSQSGKTGLEGMRCFVCRQFGHIKRDCPDKQSVEKALFSAEEKQKPLCTRMQRHFEVRHQGRVEDREVHDIWLDTGCTQTMVHADLVPPEKFLEGSAVTVLCSHGDTVLYPLAKIAMQVDGLEIVVDAAVSERLPVAVLLGKDVPEFAQLLGTEKASSRVGEQQKEAMRVVTQAQSCRKLEEEVLGREKEPLAGVQPNLVDREQEESVTETAEVGQAEDVRQLTKNQRWQLYQQYHEMEVGETELSKYSLEISAEELRTLQEEENTLAKVCEAVRPLPRAKSGNKYAVELAWPYMFLDGEHRAETKNGNADALSCVATST